MVALDVLITLIQKNKYRKSTRRLNTFELFMVNLNREAYKDPLMRKSIGAFEYQPFLSNREDAVYLNRQTKTVYIIYKGTSNLENVITDLKLVGNIADSNFRKALDTFELVKRTLPGNAIFVSGHSLGATKAIYVGSKKAVKGIVFNPFTPNIFGKLHTMSKNSGNILKVVNKGDTLSNNQLVINPPNMIVFVTKILKSNFYNNHRLPFYQSMDNFIF